MKMEIPDTLLYLVLMALCVYGCAAIVLKKCEPIPVSAKEI